MTDASNTTDDRPNESGDATEVVGNRPDDRGEATERPDDADRWRILRQLYESGVVTVEDIASVGGLSRSTINRHAKAEGWTRRSRRLETGRRAALARAKAEAGQAADEKRSAADIRRADALSSLWQALARQIAVIERHAGEKPHDQQREERDARTLSTLVRALEKLAELDRRGAQRTGQRPARDVSALRRELGERLDRLERKGFPRPVVRRA